MKLDHPLPAQSLLKSKRFSLVAYLPYCQFNSHLRSELKCKTSIIPSFYPSKFILILCLFILHKSELVAQSSKKQILVDVAHGQKFYKGPLDTNGMDKGALDRLQYLHTQLSKNASSLNAGVVFQKTNITLEELKKHTLLFIHVPTSTYSAEEITAIQQYLQEGGALFIVMEVDYWTTLAQSNINNIISPLGIYFKKDHADSISSGGHSTIGKVTSKRFKIPYHGARIVEGGTPFCYSNQKRDHYFGVYKELKGGGKIIAMGDGMASLYMNSWEGVDDYQTSAFMEEVLRWLLK